MEYTRWDAAIQSPRATATGRFGGPDAADVAALPGVSGAPARHSVRAQVLTALRGALLCGDLEPGRVYSAPVLAERYGVSATPVREAMQQLESEGLVQTVRNRGFRVAALSRRDVDELAEVRAAIEVPALCALAAASPGICWEELRPLADATVAAATRGVPTRYAEADLAFHRGVLERTGNRQLVSVAAELHRRAQCRVTGGAHGNRTALATAALGHGALLDALAAGDRLRTERLTREHFSRC